MKILHYVGNIIGVHTNCGRKCSASSGIHEGITFGNGELDEHGYWEKPCYVCARGWDVKFNNEFYPSGESMTPAWPFKRDEVLQW